MDFASIDSYTFVDSSNDLALLVSDARGWEGTSLFFLFAENDLVPVGLSNRYQWMPKAPGEKSGVLAEANGLGLGYQL